jgi:ABC-type branched-subunit amino acid transport system substrate-binding protein
VNRRSWLAFLSVAPLVLLASCSGGSGTGGGGGGDELTLGGLLPLSGESAEFGSSMAQAMELAAEQINACGAIDLSLTIEDDGTDEQTAAASAQKLVNVDGVPAVVGSVASRITLAVADTMIGAETVLVAPGSSSPALTDYDDDGFVFRTLPSDHDQGPAIAQVAASEGFETVNVIALNDDYGQGLSEVFTEAHEADGGTVGSVTLIDPHGVDFTADVRQALSGEPDALLLAVFPETGAGVLGALQQQGALGSVPLLMMNGLAVDGLPEDAGVDLDGELGVRPTSGGEGDPYFVETFQEKFDEAPGYATANAYDAVLVLTLAALAGDDFSGASIRDQMPSVTDGGTSFTPDQICEAIEAAQAGEDIDLEGASSNLAFDENGDLSNPVFDKWTFREGVPERIELIELPS